MTATFRNAGGCGFECQMYQMQTVKLNEKIGCRKIQSISQQIQASTYLNILHTGCAGQSRGGCEIPHPEKDKQSQYWSVQYVKAFGVLLVHLNLTNTHYEG